MLRIEGHVAKLTSIGFDSNMLGFNMVEYFVEGNALFDMAIGSVTFTAADTTFIVLIIDNPSFAFPPSFLLCWLVVSFCKDIKVQLNEGVEQNCEPFCWLLYEHC